MRVSTDDQDPGYANWKGRQFEVRVDGRVLTHCITADEESGWAMYQVVDQLGKHVWSVHGRELMARSVFGRVQIIDVTACRADARREIEQLRHEAAQLRCEAAELIGAAKELREPPVKIALAADVMVRALR